MPASLTHGELIVEVGRLVSNYVIENRLPGEIYSDAGFVLGRDPERMRGLDSSPTCGQGHGGIR